MTKRFSIILVLLFCAVFALSGCGANKNVAYSNNSINMNIEKEENSSEVSLQSQVSSGNNSQSNKSIKNTSSKNEDSDNSSSDTFAAPIVQGGTVIGTTNKGYEITQKNGVVYINGVLIVNKTYALNEKYNPGLQSLCSRAFNKMKAAAKKDGIFIWISSGFRSYNTQKRLYDSYCNRDGALLADRYSARPGHSEHQTGLAIDVNSASTAAYETVYKNVGDWLKEHCWEYGFIIRYPEGKESITGYKHEPWHIRYVGTELSLLLKESGQTLEEYFGITSFYASGETNEDNNSSDISSDESQENSQLPSESQDNSSLIESVDSSSNDESQESDELLS